MNESTPEVTPSQPSAPLTAPVQTAAEAAIASGDQAAFREARRAEKTPTPTAPKGDSRSPTPARPAAPTGASTAEASEASTPTAPTATPPRGNAKTRLAEVDAEVTALKAKLAERDDLLRRSRETEPAHTPPRRPDTTAPAARGPQLPAEVASYEAYLATHPEATLEEFFDARSDARQELKVQRQQAQQRQEARQAAVQQEVDTFAQRVHDAVTADPTFVDRVQPHILALKPVVALAPGDRIGPGNVLAQELLRSDAPVKVMEELSAHPDEFQRLMQAKNPGEVIRGLAKIEARVTGAPVAERPPFKPTQTPAPPTTLGRRPVDTLPATEAAIRDGDMVAFKAAKQAERAARFSRH